MNDQLIPRIAAKIMIPHILPFAFSLACVKLVCGCSSFCVAGGG
jgi:hypothetical protein